eukprot:766591-Hanusia_phi.AAC.4
MKMRLYTRNLTPSSTLLMLREGNSAGSPSTAHSLTASTCRKVLVSEHHRQMSRANVFCIRSPSSSDESRFRQKIYLRSLSLSIESSQIPYPGFIQDFDLQVWIVSVP